MTPLTLHGYSIVQGHSLPVWRSDAWLHHRGPGYHLSLVTPRERHGQLNLFGAAS